MEQGSVRDEAAMSAAGRLADLVPDLQDYARAWILGQPLPKLENDLATVARRIADEELDRVGEERLTNAEDWEPDE